MKKVVIKYRKEGQLCERVMKSLVQDDLNNEQIYEYAIHEILLDLGVESYNLDTDNYDVSWARVAEEKNYDRD